MWAGPGAGETVQGWCGSLQEVQGAEQLGVGWEQSLQEL